MPNIWSGSIAVSENTILNEVILASQNVASALTISDATLRFLATVDTARIPLCLAAGPSFEVWTTNEDTEQWFQSILLSSAGSKTIKPNDLDRVAQQWWTCPRSQSPIGILVQVEGHIPDRQQSRITEILFYGTVATTVGHLPTPPSSSPGGSHLSTEPIAELRVHALPLSADLLQFSTQVGQPLPSPAQTPTSEPQFLPLSRPELPLAPSPKRKRDIFDEATQLKAKARRKGGEGVAAAASRASESQPLFRHRTSMSIDARTSPFPDSRPASANGTLSRPPSRRLSRSPSLSSDTRPASRKGLQDGQAKRSTLSHVETASLQPDEPTLETRNKEALSRIVMAAMRMHGLQQRKKNKSKGDSIATGSTMYDRPSEEALAEEAAKDEEYKLIYHQTYKGAALAFKKHIAVKSLHLQPDRLRDIVEKLLSIFCTDPLTQPLPLEETQNVLATPGGPKQIGIPGSSHSRASPFDLPSGKALAAMKQAQHGLQHTGSPMARNHDPEDYFGPI